MIKVTLTRNGHYLSEFYMNVSHIREKNTVVKEYIPFERVIKTKEGGETINIVYDEMVPIEYMAFNQFGGYTVGAYSLPSSHINPPHYACHNRIVISRCSPKDNYDRHKGIMCCIEKIVGKLWPEENFTLVPQFNTLGRLISADKSIKIDLQ